MSKIHKALERAQRSREAGLKSDSLFFPQVQEKREDQPEEVRKAREVEEIITNQKLVSFYEPESLAAEQFRKLRTKLLRLSLARPPRTIMVTSALGGEGKTLVAANLAAGIAYEFHASSVLIDCDLRKPSLGQWFGLSNGHGLADYLVGKKGISDLLLKTEVEKLTLLLSGPFQSNPTELIGSERMEALIQELKLRYSDRYIILDTPPLLATSEPEILSRFVDGIVIVVRAGVTRRETVKQAISTIEKEKILGFVLNDLQFKSSDLSSRYFGSEYSYYGYGYGKSQRESRKRR